MVQEETKVAELQAEQKEQQLQVDVRRPADAEAYRQTTLAAAARDVAIRQAEAEAQQVRLHAEAAAVAVKVQAEAQAAATRLNGQAEADAIRARGMAEADAVKARMEAEATGIERRAAALSQNQEAVIAQQIAENLPAIVEAAASPFEHVGNFTVLNGAEGVTGALAQIIQQAGTLAGMARETLMPKPITTNGRVESANGASEPNRERRVAESSRPARSRAQALAASPAASPPALPADGTSGRNGPGDPGTPA